VGSDNDEPHLPCQYDTTHHSYQNSIQIETATQTKTTSEKQTPTPKNNYH